MGYKSLMKNRSNFKMKTITKKQLIKAISDIGLTAIEDTFDKEKCYEAGGYHSAGYNSYEIKIETTKEIWIMGDKTTGEDWYWDLKILTEAQYNFINNHPQMNVSTNIIGIFNISYPVNENTISRNIRNLSNYDLILVNDFIKKLKEGSK